MLEYREKNMTIEYEYFCKVSEYDVKTVYKDEGVWSKLLKNSTKIWNEIEKERQLTDNELLKKYKNILELIDTHKNENENETVTQESTLFRKRNLRKIKKRKVEPIEDTYEPKDNLKYDGFD